MEEANVDVLSTKPALPTSSTCEPLVPEDQETAEDPTSIDELEVDRRDHRFGFFGFHPNFLQVFRNAKFFTLLLCLFSLVEGAIVSGIIAVTFV